MNINLATKKLFQKDDKVAYLYELARLGEISVDDFKALFYAISALEINRAMREIR